MIILLGADASGKTTLCKQMGSSGKKTAHFNMHSSYIDYLLPLTSLHYRDAVLDRFIICECVYSSIKNRKIKFSPQEFQNILMITLIQDPIFILATHIPSKDDYGKSQYIKWEELGEARSMYANFLDTHHIPYIPYDYEHIDITLDRLSKLEQSHIKFNLWWEDMWRAGYGCAGSPAPKVLIVAEQLGPSNYHHIPFEAGPTGLMMTDLMKGVPLWDYTITNWLKTGDSTRDEELLRIELENLSPLHVILMGSVALKGCSGILRKLQIPYTHVPHLGYVNRQKHLWPRYKKAFAQLWAKIAE